MNEIASGEGQFSNKFKAAIAALVLSATVLSATEFSNIDPNNFNTTPKIERDNNYQPLESSKINYFDNITQNEILKQSFIEQLNDSIRTIDKYSFNELNKTFLEGDKIKLGEIINNGNFPSYFNTKALQLEMNLHINNKNNDNSSFIKILDQNISLAFENNSEKLFNDPHSYRVAEVFSTINHFNTFKLNAGTNYTSKEQRLKAEYGFR